MDSILLELDELKSSHGKKKKKLFVKLNHEQFNNMSIEVLDDTKLKAIKGYLIEGNDGK